jgi:hypothetical protein
MAGRMKMGGGLRQLTGRCGGSDRHGNGEVAVDEKSWEARDEVGAPKHKLRLHFWITGGHRAKWGRCLEQSLEMFLR